MLLHLSVSPKSTAAKMTTRRTTLDPPTWIMLELPRALHFILGILTCPRTPNVGYGRLRVLPFVRYQWFCTWFLYWTTWLRSGSCATRASRSRCICPFRRGYLLCVFLYIRRCVPLLLWIPLHCFALYHLRLSCHSTGTVFFQHYRSWLFLPFNCIYHR